MTTVYQALANSVAIVHSLVALYLLSLPFIVFKRNVPNLYFQLQAGILGIAGIFHFTTGVCPLTFGENYLRVLGGGKMYKGNFLNHYAETFLDISVPSKLVSNTIILLAILLLFSILKKGRLKQNLRTTDAFINADDVEKSGT